MKKLDFVWLAAVAAFLLLMLIEPMAGVYRAFNANHPYLTGFIKFAYLATLGDIFSLRLVRKQWTKLPGIGYRAVVYGFIGMLITLVFQVFGAGVAAAMAAGYLPFEGSAFAQAFLTSLLLNTLFAPTFMAFHRVTDTFFDLRCRDKKWPTLKTVAQTIDFTGFITFVVVKTLPFFWIPAHTVTFLLPGEYRVLFAAALSIALGGILSFAKTRKAA